jgi:hypothetical protein
MKNIYLGYSVVIKDKWGETIYTFKELKKAKEMMKETIERVGQVREDVKQLHKLLPKELSVNFGNLK